MHKPPRSEQEIERKILELALKERVLGLAMQFVLLVVTFALAVTTIICALRGTPWPVPAGVGGFGVATSLLGVGAMEHGRSHRD